MTSFMAGYMCELYSGLAVQARGGIPQQPKDTGDWYGVAQTFREHVSAYALPARGFQVTEGG